MSEKLTINFIDVDKLDSVNYYGFIYITENILNGRKYIGQKTFKHNWENYLGSGKILKQAIELYGKENFKRSIIALARNKKELDDLEIFYINKFEAVSSNEFYNIHSGGSGGNTIAGFTDIEMEKFKSKQRGENNSFYGKKHSEETKKKMSENRKGKNNPNYGKHLTKEQKQAISEKNKKFQRDKHPSAKKYSIILRNGEEKNFLCMLDMLDYLNISKQAFYRLKNGNIPTKGNILNVYNILIEVKKENKSIYTRN